MVIRPPEDPFVYYNLVEEELDTQPAIERQRPPSIDFLLATTKFSRNEIQYLYRTFKELWPNGTVTLEQFQNIYSEIFPQGNSKSYAELVFRNIDRGRKGSISFMDFLINFSKIAKGDIDEKLDWIFSLYDASNCGFIGYNEIYCVVRAMYQLVDSTLKPAVIATICRQHVKLVLKKMSIQHTTRLSREEFYEKCKTNTEIMGSLEILEQFPKEFLSINTM